MHQQDTKKTIGRAERVKLSSLGTTNVHARIDTGARTSAIWASEIVREGDRLGVVFFGKKSSFYSGETHYFDAFERTVVASSNGQSEERYVVKLLIVIAGKKIRARFTLADRSAQVYPVLIGRNILRGKFTVDVKQGKPLRNEERRRSQQLQSRLRARR